jgi:hypothetical protein
MQVDRLRTVPTSTTWIFTSGSGGKASLFRRLNKPDCLQNLAGEGKRQLRKDWDFETPRV